MLTQAPPELALGPARLAQEASAWVPLLPCATSTDLLAFAGTCLQPPLAASLHLLGGLGQALLGAAGSCLVAASDESAAESAAEVANHALLLLGMLCERLTPDRVRLVELCMVAFPVYVSSVPDEAQ